MSLGVLTTDEDVGRVAEVFPALALKARGLSERQLASRPRRDVGRCRFVGGRRDAGANGGST